MFKFKWQTEENRETIQAGTVILSYGVPLPLESAVFAKSSHRGSLSACWLRAGNMSTICLDLLHKDLQQESGRLADVQNGGVVQTRKRKSMPGREFGKEQ